MLGFVSFSELTRRHILPRIHGGVTLLHVPECQPFALKEVVMDMFSSKGPAGLGVAYVSFSVLKALLHHLEASGALIPRDINTILADAIAQISGTNIAARDDARGLIESLKH